MWIFEPPGAKGVYVDICDARGQRGIWGYLCRQGPNYLETCDPEGVKEDFGRICDAGGQRVNRPRRGRMFIGFVPPGAKGV